MLANSSGSPLNSSTLDVGQNSVSSLNISCVKDKIEDYTIDDFKLSNYKYHEKINMEMRK